MTRVSMRAKSKKKNVMEYNRVIHEEGMVPRYQREIK